MFNNIKSPKMMVSHWPGTSNNDTTNSINLHFKLIKPNQIESADSHIQLNWHSPQFFSQASQQIWVFPQLAHWCYSPSTTSLQVRRLWFTKTGAKNSSLNAWFFFLSCLNDNSAPFWSRCTTLLIQPSNITLVSMCSSALPPFLCNLVFKNPYQGLTWAAFDKKHNNIHWYTEWIWK